MKQHNVILDTGLSNKVEGLNSVLQSQEFKDFIKSKFSTKMRMCLNRNNVEDIRLFISSYINAYLILGVDIEDLDTFYTDFDGFLNQKIQQLNLQNKHDFYNYICEKLKSLGFFHGTSFCVNDNFDFAKLNKNLNIVNDIYEKHGIYKCFESKLKEGDDFWLTNAVKSAVFYAYQSPEFLARFASRSDYYKQDPFIYDKLAYYRKDYKACKKNCKIEMKRFGFSNEEKKTVLNTFKTIWDLVVSELNEPAIKFVENAPNALPNFKRFSNKEIEKLSYEELYRSIFIKHNFSIKRNDVKFKNISINLPNIKDLIKKEHPIKNKKFVYYNNKKYYPDFYAIGNLFPKTVYFLKKQQDNIPKSACLLDVMNCEEDIKAEILMCYSANSKKANKVMSTLEKEFDKDRLIKLYKDKLQSSVAKLQLCSKDFEKCEIISKIYNDVGLKYLALAHFNTYFKHANQAFMYTYTKLLGRKLCENFNKFGNIKNDELLKLIETYNTLLNEPRKIIESSFLIDTIHGIC